MNFERYFCPCQKNVEFSAQSADLVNFEDVTWEVVNLVIQSLKKWGWGNCISFPHSKFWGLFSRNLRPCGHVGIFSEVSTCRNRDLFVHVRDVGPYILYRSYADDA